MWQVSENGSCRCCRAAVGTTVQTAPGPEVVGWWEDGGCGFRRLMVRCGIGDWPRHAKRILGGDNEHATTAADHRQKREQDSRETMRTRAARGAWRWEEEARRGGDERRVGWRD